MFLQASSQHLFFKKTCTFLLRCCVQSIKHHADTLISHGSVVVLVAEAGGFQDLKAAALINTVSLLWSYGLRLMRMLWLICPVTLCLPIEKKRGDPHVGGEITLDSQTFIRLWMLKSPPRKREMKKKYEMRVRERRGAMRESAESRNHVTWCLLAKVAYIAETVN